MYQRIVVGTDGSPTATEAVKVAAELARRFGGELHVVRAYQPASQHYASAAMVPVASTGILEYDELIRTDVETNLDDLSRSPELNGLTVETHARPQAATDAILAVAEEVKADLIVVGNRGMHGAKRIFGSVPNSITHHANCSVLVVNTCH